MKVEFSKLKVGDVFMVQRAPRVFIKTRLQKMAEYNCNAQNHHGEGLFLTGRQLVNKIKERE